MAKVKAGMMGVITGKGLFTDSLEIEENKVYYQGGHIPCDIVYVTRIVDDMVYHVHIVQRGMHSTNEYYEQRERLNIFANGAAYSLSKMQDNFKAHVYYLDEIAAVATGNPDAFEIPEFTSWETKQQERAIKQKESDAIRAKTTHYDAKETAKLIRTILKENFPSTKFSVRKTRSTYSYNVDIKWTDGPTKSEVEKLVGHMKAGHFDGMQDLYINDKPQDNGDGTYSTYGNRYVGMERNYTVENYTKLRDMVCKKYGKDTADYPVATHESGEPYINNNQYAFGRDSMATLIWREAREVSFVEDIPQEKENAPKETTDTFDVQYGEYKGHPTIGLPMPNGKTFNFGLSKAQAIVDNIEAIKAWIEQNE